MFKESKNSSIFISAKKGVFIYNDTELKPGTGIQAEIKSISIETDPGNKEHKIKPGEKAVIKLFSEETGETANFYVNLSGFTGKKILCLLPSIESPFISIGIKKGSEEIPSIFLGSSIDVKSPVKWHKTKFTFDSEGDIFNRETKETISPAEILESVSDLINVPFLDLRK
jgi:hypothetical protein